MQKNHKKQTKGYTLIELSVVIVLVILISSTLAAMLTQQAQFLRWWRSQDFIAEDAPLANAMVVKLFSSADAFRIHTDLAGALAGNGGTIGKQPGDAADDPEATAMVLGFTLVDGSRRQGILWFDAGSETLQYGFNPVGGAFPAGNTWTVASGIEKASFTVANGTMQITLTGPFGGRVTYAATPSL